MPEWFVHFYDSHAVWLLPALIFFARVVDVSIGTMRIVFLSRGMRLLAPVFGFFEVLIWLIAISRIMGNLTSWVNYVAYASGFAAGNYVGMYLENRLAMGLLSVMVITPDDASPLVRMFTEQRFGVTRVAGQGAQGEVGVIYVIIKRRDLDQVSRMLKEHRPDAFVVVNDIRNAAGGVFPVEAMRANLWRRLLGGQRKDK